MTAERHLTLEEKTEIAKAFFEENQSQAEIAAKFNVTNKTISRVINTGRDKDWEVIVRPKTTDKVGLDEVLKRKLRQKFNGKMQFQDIYVVKIRGVDAAYGDDYLSHDPTIRERAFEDIDQLHIQLAHEAGRFLCSTFATPDFALGVGSGRAVMFSVLRAIKLAQESIIKPKGYQVFSLHGGFMVRAWSQKITAKMPYHLDSNEVAFRIQTAFALPAANVHYVSNDIANEDPLDTLQQLTEHVEKSTGGRLDACLLGVGVLNSEHSFLKSIEDHPLGEYQARAMQDELTLIKKAQNDLSSRLGVKCLADIAHQLFPLSAIPAKVETAIEKLNKKMVTPVDVIRNARQIFLCAGSSQKYPAIYKLFHDPGMKAKVPIDITRTTLITDQHCATNLLNDTKPDFS